MQSAMQNYNPQEGEEEEEEEKWLLQTAPTSARDEHLNWFGSSSQSQ